MLLIGLLIVSSVLAVSLEGDQSILFLVFTGFFLGGLMAEKGNPLLGAMQVAVFAGLGAFFYFYRRWRP